MAFYIVVNGHLTNHNFDYLTSISGRRLDPTLVPNSPQKSKVLPKNANTFAIEIMSKELYFLEEKTSIKESLKIFKEKKVHHLPITSKGVLKGLVSDRDILWLEKFDLTENSKLAQFMSRTVLCCEEETPIEHLAKVMVNEHISALPVINKESKLTGIITHHDILRWIYDF